MFGDRMIDRLFFSELLMVIASSFLSPSTLTESGNNENNNTLITILSNHSYDHRYDVIIIMQPILFTRPGR